MWYHIKWSEEKETLVFARTVEELFDILDCADDPFATQVLPLGNAGFAIDIKRKRVEDESEPGQHYLVFETIGHEEYEPSCELLNKIFLEEEKKGRVKSGQELFKGKDMVTRVYEEHERRKGEN